MVLLDFPPLACFLNGLLVAFNDLRLCCPIALAQDVTACLDSALGEVTKTILAFHRAEEAAFSGREQELFAQFCTAFLEDLLPYLNRCLQVLFPPSQIAQALGIPPTQLQRFGRLGRIDVAALREPLAFLLPPAYPAALRRAHRIEPFPLRLLVNPALRVLDTRLVTAPEGCASIHGFSAYVPRHWAVHVSGVDELGVPVSWEAMGWAARIIQHEMDHLDGILYIDRMDPRTFTNVGWMELMD
ncbi:conserved oligomeric Golgi complex subunit 8-like [Manacus vitellinus]|uniref:conserved oligomeric Golgi complex subunit 8-like n=1 Tax=Manacus vitellinus TaxID=328815 RepID=UPI00115D6A86|nr:conserved oligomeric Golgi complex subunit 8-like [Manacus vitellinus]